MKNVRIRYWVQETQESGRFVTTQLMTLDAAEKIITQYERGKIDDSDPCDGCNKAPVDCPGWVPELSDTEQPCKEGITA